MTRAALDVLRAPVALAVVLALAPIMGARAQHVVTGRVVDAASRAPVGAAEVRLVELARTASTDGEGRFRFAAVPPGAHTLRVRRLGYALQERSLRVDAGEVDTLVVRLAPTPLRLAQVQVRGGGREPLPGEGFQPASVLEGAALDRQLGASVAASIALEPGVTARTNGPHAAQPVVRGLGGDRVLVLEGGLRTGDIATTAPDHAVTIEPLSARRIEVVRGPAGLLHGASTLGGVVNVVRADVPTERPERPTTTAGVHVESVNRGATGLLAFTAPLGGRAAVTLEATGRTAGDTRTPGGPLPFTDLDGRELAAGASVVGARGHAGIAVRDHRAYYGVPSSFAGRTLPGAHDGGVYVDLRRTTARVEGELRRETGALRSLRALGSYVYFDQAEHERGGFVGTRFGQLSASGELLARLEHGRHLVAVGAAGQWRDFRAAGSYTGTRPARLRTAAAFAVDEIDLAPVRLLAGLRWDRVGVVPLDSTETRLLRDVRTREFGATTGALGATMALGGDWTIGASVARAFRPPAVEELYSAGPHLASYAYEVGNPSLHAEVGAGVDAFVRLRRPTVQAELAAFRNEVRDFIQYVPLVDPATGAPMRDPRLRRYVVYQARQSDVRLIGAEATAQWEPWRGVAIEGVASWVHGTQREDDAPLPAMPPLHGRVAVRRDTPTWFGGLGADWAVRQARVPAAPMAVGTCIPGAGGGEVELQPAEFCSTPGAARLELSAGRRWLPGRQLHVVTLVVDNLLDAEWRDHLWRAKQVAPQPGRNVKLLYRVTY